MSGERDGAGDLDTLMMDDFTPDLDLLDDLLGVQYDDWKELEPSLNQCPIHMQTQQPLLLGHDNQLGFSQMYAEDLKPFPIQIPDFAVLQKQNMFVQQQLPHPLEIQQPQSQSPPPLRLQQQQSPPPVRIQQQPQAIQPQPPPQVQATLAPQPQKILTQILPNQQNNKVFSFTGIPISAPAGIYTGNTTTTVILPQLQLAVLDNNGGDKLPMKRLSNNLVLETGLKDPSPTSKKSNKKEVNRRSSHNAIERRYRSSINDKILELRNLVCRTSEPNEKVHKAAVLRNSIDTVKYLQNSNNRLEKENRGLKSTLSQIRKCGNCGTDQPPIVTYNANSNADLRELLTDNSPPPTSGSSNGDSSPPATPSSPDEELPQSPAGSNSSKASPIALFAIAAGLFLINPVHKQHLNDEFPDTHRSRVERSVEDEHPHPHPIHHWSPAIIALVVNLFLFLAIYFFAGKLFKSTKKLSKYPEDLASKLKKRLDSYLKDGKRSELQTLIKDITGKPVVNNWLLKLKTYGLSIKAPFSIWMADRQAGVDSKVDLVLSRCYLEIGKDDITVAKYCGLKALSHCLHHDAARCEEILISSCMLIKSKLVLKMILMKYSLAHPLVNQKLGLNFFNANMKTWHSTSSPNTFTSCVDQTENLSKLTGKFKYEVMCKGVSQLFHYGEGASHYFKIAIQTILHERRSEKSADLNGEWWACVLWAQAETLSRGGRAPVLERLHKAVDSLWKHQTEDPICRAVYFTHLAKRLLTNDEIPLKSSSVKRLVDSAAEALRDSINLTTDKPKPIVQLLWALTAEWILEIRLELWEDSNIATDIEFTCQFSRDLDTLRSLTHYIPTCLSSVYLYEACLRLMSRASPGRTQQLLDASLRSVRLNSRGGIICTSSNSVGATIDHEDLSLPPSDASCTRRRMDDGNNLVREKRKAIALYLRCKHLPSQVITCPGEKAGMLREALKAMEKFGDFKKINECLDMIKNIGQSVTLH